MVSVSGPVEKTENRNIDGFLDKPFDWKKIRTKAKKFAIIHGDNDPYVPFRNAEILSKELGGELITVKNGGHLNGSAGWFTLPQCLEVLVKMMD
jgi:predicted alpha/beta hydrolase family esterase